MQEVLTAHQEERATLEAELTAVRDELAIARERCEALQEAVEN
jgi:hypothetical protein